MKLSNNIRDGSNYCTRGVSTITDFTKTAIAIIQKIPEGKVMTYGQIAALAGSPRGARQVVRILHAMSRKYHLPWHRVVNVHGQISLVDFESRSMQIFYLESEGVEIVNDTIDLDIYQHHPTEIPFLD